MAFLTHIFTQILTYKSDILFFKSNSLLESRYVFRIIRKDIVRKASKTFQNILDMCYANKPCHKKRIGSKFFFSFSFCSQLANWSFFFYLSRTHSLPREKSRGLHFLYWMDIIRLVAMCFHSVSTHEIEIEREKVRGKSFGSNAFRFSTFRS